MTDILSFIDINTDLRHPTGINKYIRGWLESNGTTEYKEIVIDNRKIKARVKYTPNHNDRYVIVIVDHISLLEPEKGLSLHQTISRWSSNYCIDLRDMYKCSIVNVQQQASAQESLDNFKYSKLEPGLPGLADNKLTQRDANKVIGVFMPNRYGLKNYRKFNIEEFKDTLVFLSVIKNREGRSNLYLPLKFNGRINNYEEI